MKTSDVLKFCRNMLGRGFSPFSCSFGDWPEAVAYYDRANRESDDPRRWAVRWLPTWLCPRAWVIASLNRAIALAEADQR